MNLICEIKFLDYWHLSSGLSAGSKLDSSVVKDENNIPFIPAKTIKGLVRQMAELSEDKNFVNICFGYSSDKKDRFYDKDKKATIAKCYFSNAYLNHETYQAITNANLQNNLYDEISSTKVDKQTGVAVDKSLRQIEVVVPLSLYCEIKNIPDTYKDLMKNALKSVKCMGLSRNRGLGRCVVRIVGEENE